MGSNWNAAHLLFHTWAVSHEDRVFPLDGRDWTFWGDAGRQSADWISEVREEAWIGRGWERWEPFSGWSAPTWRLVYLSGCCFCLGLPGETQEPGPPVECVYWSVYLWVCSLKTSSRVSRCIASSFANVFTLACMCACAHARANSNTCCVCCWAGLCTDAKMCD